MMKLPETATISGPSRRSVLKGAAATAVAAMGVDAAGDADAAGSGGDLDDAARATAQPNFGQERTDRDGALFAATVTETAALVVWLPRVSVATAVSA